MLRRRVPRIERVLADTMPVGHFLLQIKDAPFSRPVLARFASDGTLEISKEWARSELDPVLALHLANLPDQILGLGSLRGRVITDDFNRMDLYSAPVEIALRRSSRNLLPASILEP